MLRSRELLGIPKRRHCKSTTNPNAVVIPVADRTGTIDSDAIIAVMQNIISRIGLTRAVELWGTATQTMKARGAA